MSESRLDCGVQGHLTLSLSRRGDKRVMGQEQRSHHNDDPQAGTNAMGLVTSLDGLVNAVTKGTEEEVRPYGLSVVEYNLLKTCMERSEANATDLADVLPVDAPRVSRIVTGLVEKGLLIRRRLRNDRRIVMLRLSEQGQELTSMLRQRIDAYDARLREGIGDDEMRVFVSVTEKIVANYVGSKES